MEYLSHSEQETEALGAALALKTMFTDSEPADRAEIAGKLAEAKRRRERKRSAA